MTYVRVFMIATIGALSGMVMGGLFGLGYGLVAPKLFSRVIPWADVEPVGAATVYGAIAGVLLGGGLAVFAILVQLMHGLIVRNNGVR